MTEDKESLQEWLDEERKRLDEGFSYEPQPGSKTDTSADDILAELGLGAGILAGPVAGHANPVTFEGCKASTIAGALKSEFAADDTRVEIRQTDDATTVSVLQQQEPRQPYVPALTVTLLESAETLTVAMGDLSQEARRSAIGSLGKTALRQSRDMLLRRRGLVGMLNAAGNLVEGIEEAAEDIQDLTLPRRAWAVIDRVGRTAEDAYLEEQGRIQALKRKREEAERAWTHCEWCGRAYAPAEENVVQCPSCGAPRGPKPHWLP